MADPFRRSRPASPFGRSNRPTTNQFVSSGGFDTPMSKEWLLENAVVNGYKASGWVYSCAKILATHVSSLEWRVWERTSSGDSRPIPGHDLEFLIEHPNSKQTRSFQMTMRTLHLCLGGNSLDKVVMVGPSRKPEPSELWPMRLDSTRPIPSEDDWLKCWRVTNVAGATFEDLDPSRVVHSQFADPDDPFWGMPPLRAIGKVVDMDVSQVEWNRELMENDAAPSGVFTDPNAKTKEERKLIKEALRNSFSGPLGAREPLVLSNGAQWHQLGITPRELDWILSRKFTVGEICTAFGLLTSRFLMDAATYNNLEQAIKYEWQNGALPIANLIGDGMGLTLLTHEQRRAGMKIRPDTSTVPALKDDVHKAAETYVALRSNGVPAQMAASICNLPVGELPGGDLAFHSATMEQIGGDPDNDL